MARVLLPALVLSVLSAAAAAQENFRSYPSKYYTIHTDLDAETVKEARLRLTLMFEEYRARTQGIGEAVKEKMPFYLFKNPADYLAQGGPPGTAGVYMPGRKRLMAIAGDRVSEQTWHTIQHEGFHQFLDAALEGEVPIWANEGLAEYFGEAIFTGDNVVIGVIPPQRLARVRRSIDEGRFASLSKMMTLSHEVWNAQMKGENYDQAWSMVHFLAHGDGGRYQQAFNGFLRAVARREPWQDAWRANFGTDVAAFEKRWKDYWLNLSPNPTADRYARATVATLTSFLARATSQRQQLETAEEFFKLAREGALKQNAEDWLPPALLADALAGADTLGTWEVQSKSSTSRKLVLTMKDGTTLTGTFRVSGNRVKDVDVAVTDPKRDQAQRRRR